MGRRFKRRTTIGWLKPLGPIVKKVHRFRGASNVFFRYGAGKYDVTYILFDLLDRKSSGNINDSFYSFLCGQYGYFIINKVSFKLYNVSIDTREYERAEGGGLDWDATDDNRPFANQEFFSADNANNQGFYMLWGRSILDADSNYSLGADEQLRVNRIYGFGVRGRRQTFHSTYYPRAKTRMVAVRSNMFDKLSIKELLNKMGVTDARYKFICGYGPWQAPPPKTSKTAAYEVAVRFEHSISVYCTFSGRVPADLQA